MIPKSYEPAKRGIKCCSCRYSETLNIDGYKTFCFITEKLAKEEIKFAWDLFFLEKYKHLLVDSEGKCSEGRH